MYVNKKLDTISFKPGYFAEISLIARSAYIPGSIRIHLYSYRYPCGRIKLVCPCGSLAFTGVYGCDIIFDSVSSLYNAPGVHIYTNPASVYTLLGMTPYGCK